VARPPRLEFASALYHVTARGNERRDIFLGDADGDRAALLNVLGATCERFNWLIHVDCLMTNHDHLLVETPDANLSEGMRQLNGAPGWLETDAVLRVFSDERTTAVNGYRRSRPKASAPPARGKGSRARPLHSSTPAPQTGRKQGGQTRAGVGINAVRIEPVSIMQADGILQLAASTCLLPSNALRPIP
jgi:hypothetical protein